MVPILSFELISTAMTSEQGVLFPDTEDTSEVSVSEDKSSGKRSLEDFLLQAEFVSNRPNQAKVVSQTIERELLKCDRYDISVAFITAGGIAPIKLALKELDDRGVKGRLLTTDYELFTEPSALEGLLELKHLEIRLFRVNDDPKDGFHTKGYLFHDEKKNILRVLIGSSNLTSKALSINREWNALIVSPEEETFARDLQEEFEELWVDQRSQLLTKETLADYAAIIAEHEKARRDYEKALVKLKTGKEPENLIPNAMQAKFVEALTSLRDQGEDRALLISATGTGKTYASAFGVKAFAPKRLLFIVHRAQIAEAAMKSYKKVLGGEDSLYGLLSGDHKDTDARYVFATIQTLAKDKWLEKFKANDFDLIVIDESHHSGAETYQDVMAHFQPKMWLGMTATPERTDGFDIYSLFGHNIAHEIRLQEALEEELLCPFHYYGIDDDAVDPQDINKFSVKDRARYIEEQVNYYRYSGDRVKGLIFCAEREVAAKLSEELNSRGWRTKALTGDDTQEQRKEAIHRLVQKANNADALDYLLTVDIFNEGIDIPEVNQVVFLRETKSPIVFTQQLGRGLRKSEGKEFLVVLDFIGSYANNYLIPIALSGDRSYNKDSMRKIVVTGGSEIPGVSSVHFSQISKQRIFHAIDRAKTRTSELLIESYRNLRYKLGRRPTLVDFEDYQEIDPVKFFEQTSVSAKIHTYYDAVKIFQEEENKNKEANDLLLDIPRDWTEEEQGFYRMLSHRMGSGKRLTEWAFMNVALEGSQDVAVYARAKLEGTPEFNREVTDAELRNAIRVLTGNFADTEDKKAKQRCYALLEHPTVDIAAEEMLEDFPISGWRISSRFKSILEEQSDVATLTTELLAFAYQRWATRYQKAADGTAFVLGERYSYAEVCRLLNWHKNVIPNSIGGYFYERNTKTMPIFVNYDKAEDAINYKDHFIDERTMLTISKQKRKLGSDDEKRMTKQEPYADTVCFLFVRKNKDDGEEKAYVFLGEINAREKPKRHSVTNKKGGQEEAFEITWDLVHPVDRDLYYYLTDGES